MLKHILIKLTNIKHKGKILKAAREKQQITYKGITIRPTADLSRETVQAGRKWQDILKVMKGKKLTAKMTRTQQGSALDLKEKSKLCNQAKVKENSASPN